MPTYLENISQIGGGFKWGQAIQHGGGGVGGAFNCGQANLQGVLWGRGGGLLFSVQPFCMEGKACTANAGNHSEKLTDCFVKVARILRKRLIILRKYVDFFQTKWCQRSVNNFFFRNLQRET